MPTPSSKPSSPQTPGSTPTPTQTTNVPALPPRPPDFHKGRAGRVGVFAGSTGLSGAAVLCGLGALRGGAGLVRLYTPTSVQPIVAASEPCLMTTPLPESSAADFLAPLLEPAPLVPWADVWAIGPGLGRAAHVGAAVQALLETAALVVLDADGLAPLESAGPAALARWRAQRRSSNAATMRPAESHALEDIILTPHPGEMARLLAGAGQPALTDASDEARLRAAHAYASAAACIVVLKGHRTVVASPRVAYINTTGNPGMATGGMGDVLTGLIAALAAQGLPAFEAAVLGVWAHGHAADRLAESVGPTGFLAREVADALPQALARVQQPRIGFR